MEWKPIERADRLGIDWADCVGRPVDPYLIWADASSFKGFETIADADLYQVAVEYRGQAAPLPGLRRIVALSELSHLAVGEVGSEDLERLLHSDAVLGLEFGMAVGLVEPQAAAAPKSLEHSRGPTIAVIDFGCAFVHRNFRERTADGGWTSRIAYLWDQDRARAPDAKTWRAVHGPGYGRELTGSAIDALMARHSRYGALDEDACYAEATYADVGLDLAHGTHVLDLATRSTNANIIFVQLPVTSVADTSGASMVVHVSDALAYILERADPQSPLVVNLSYGSMAGPHDGSTLLERAMDAVIGQQQKRRSFEIVLPAGNNYESASHAQLTLKPGARPQVLHWQIMAEDPTDTFLELWYDRSESAHVRVTVTPPRGAPQSARVGQTCLARHDDDTEPFCALIHLNQPSYGKDSAMALIAVAPTRSGSRRGAQAPYGVWTVELELAEQATSPVDVFAWIERDDPSLGAGLQQPQSCFVSNTLPGTPDRTHNPIKRKLTGNSLANGVNTVVVGGCHADNEKLVRYSSAGPTRNKARLLPWPNGLAPSDQDEVIHGIRAAGTRSGVEVRMDGTSVAAPQVADLLLRTFIALQASPPSAKHQPDYPPVKPERPATAAGLLPRKGRWKGASDAASKLRTGAGRLIPASPTAR